MKKTFLLAALLGLTLTAGAAERTTAVVDGVTVTSKSLAQALGDYVEADRLAKGGSFIIEDPVTRTLVKLKPTKLDDGAHLQNVPAWHYQGLRQCTLRPRHASYTRTGCTALQAPPR
jgi:hypothetical protein